MVSSMHLILHMDTARAVLLACIAHVMLYGNYAVLAMLLVLLIAAVYINADDNMADYSLQVTVRYEYHLLLYCDICKFSCNRKWKVVTSLTAGAWCSMTEADQKRAHRQVSGYRPIWYRDCLQRSWPVAISSGDFEYEHSSASHA